MITIKVFYRSAKLKTKSENRLKKPQSSSKGRTRSLSMEVQD